MKRISLILAGTALIAASLHAQTRAAVAVPESVKVERDITYGHAGGVDLKLDVYSPKTASETPRAVTVYVHGGGWSSGDKAAGAGAMAIPELLQRGYLVVSINYRLAPKFKFPAQIEDVSCAIRYLRAHATELKLDPARIGVWGGSAGGHLVALLGTMDASAGFDTSGGWTNQSSRVKAVVDMFGPADLMVESGGESVAILDRVFGAKSRSEDVVRRASPVTYVSKDDPAFLILHGDQDRRVMLSQSERLLAALEKAGVPAKLVVVKNGGHGFGPNGGKLDPSREELAKMIGDFFDQQLGPKK